MKRYQRPGSLRRGTEAPRQGNRERARGLHQRVTKTGVSSWLLSKAGPHLGSRPGSWTEKNTAQDYSYSFSLSGQRYRFYAKNRQVTMTWGLSKRQLRGRLCEDHFTKRHSRSLSGSEWVSVCLQRPLTQARHRHPNAAHTVDGHKPLPDEYPNGFTRDYSNGSWCVLKSRAYLLSWRSRVEGTSLSPGLDPSRGRPAA